MDRRSFLSRSVALGCSLAASPLATPVSFASAPGENRLVVIVLRGGMDGLDAVVPYGDSNFAELRRDPQVGGDGLIDLDGFFAMHGALRPLLPLWRDEQLGFVHAVSTPYRNKRSHFDGQDMLEAGGLSLENKSIRDGWLNRMMGHMPNARSDMAYAIGSDALTILEGSMPVQRWSPDVDLALSPQAIRLAQLVTEKDIAMSAALNEGLRLADSDGDGVAVEGGMQEMMSMLQDNSAASKGSAYETRLAQYAAGQLRKEARIASFSLTGWDTHAQQGRLINRSLSTLAEVILTLKSELNGPAWKRTAVIAMTEFGRTARFNGTKGTDHGTGGAMILAGGAIRGGRVHAEWPGLNEADLFQRRDLMPTRDLRAYAGWLIRDLFGLPSGAVERDIFPQLDLGDDPKLLL